MTSDTTAIDEVARRYAETCHRETNHMYDGEPYIYHLEMVVGIAREFRHLIPQSDQTNVIAGCWVHDCIEDCRQTYNDVKAATSETVAELAFALTNENGKSRQDRANEKYYTGIRETPYAVFVKLCDRIANVRHSRLRGSRMFVQYAMENPGFERKLYDQQYDEMFICLRDLLA